MASSSEAQPLPSKSTRTLPQTRNPNHHVNEKEIIDLSLYGALIAISCDFNPEWIQKDNDKDKKGCSAEQSVTEEGLCHENTLGRPYLSVDNILENDDAYKDIGHGRRGVLPSVEMNFVRGTSGDQAQFSSHSCAPPEQKMML